MSPVEAFNYKPEPQFVVGKKETERIKKLYKNEEESYLLFTGRPVKGRARALSFYGTEIEMEQIKNPMVRRDDTADKYRAQVAALKMYCKHDGSLQNGFELVTHPRTYASWIQDSKAIKELLRCFRSEGMRSRDTGRCGIHFHTNLNSFENNWHIIRFGMFFHQNADFFYTASKRDPASCRKYAWFAKHPAQWAVSAHSYLAGRRARFSEHPVAMRFVNQFSAQMVLDHHAGVNITDHTIEVRFWRGTMDFTSILRIMRFLEHLKEYTKSVGFQDLTIDKFFKWVVDNKDDKKLVNHFNKVVLKKTAAPYRESPGTGERRNPVEKGSVIKFISKINTEEVAAASWGSLLSKGWDGLEAMLEKSFVSIPDDFKRHMKKLEQFNTFLQYLPVANEKNSGGKLHESAPLKPQFNKRWLTLWITRSSYHYSGRVIRMNEFPSIVTGHDPYVIPPNSKGRFYLGATPLSKMNGAVFCIPVFGSELWNTEEPESRDRSPLMLPPPEDGWYYTQDNAGRYHDMNRGTWITLEEALRNFDNVRLHTTRMAPTPPWQQRAAAAPAGGAFVWARVVDDIGQVAFQRIAPARPPRPRERVVNPLMGEPATRLVDVMRAAREQAQQLGGLPGPDPMRIPAIDDPEWE